MVKALGVFTLLVGAAACAVATWILADSAPDIARYLRMRRM